MQDNSLRNISFIFPIKEFLHLDQNGENMKAHLLNSFEYCEKYVP